MKHGNNGIACLFVAFTLAAGMSFQSASSEDANGGKQVVVQQLQDDHGRMYDAIIAKDLINLQMSPAWWTRMTASDKKGVRAVDYNTRGIYDYAQRMSWGDVATFEDTADTSGATSDEKQEKIKSMIAGWKDKVSVTFKAEPAACDSFSFDRAMRYLTAIGELLDSNDFKPPGNVAHITLVASATAKDISVTSPDGKHFIATCPANHDPEDWGTKLTTGFERLSKNRVK